MTSKRQQKVAKLLQKELGAMIQKDQWQLFKGSFVTVTHIKVSPDLSLAEVYLSLFMVKDPEQLILDIKDRKSEIRKELGLRLGKNMRIIPELIFTLDDTEEKAQRINKILGELDIPPSSEEDSEKE